MKKFGGITREDLMLMDSFDLEKAKKLCEDKLEELEGEAVKNLKSSSGGKDIKAEYQEIKEFLGLIEKEFDARESEKDRYMPTGDTPIKELSTRQIVEYLHNNERQMKALLKSHYQMKEEEIVEFFRSGLIQETADKLEERSKKKTRKSYKPQELDPDRDIARYIKDTIGLSEEMLARIQKLSEEERTRLFDAIKRHFGKLVAVDNMLSELNRQKDFAKFLETPDPFLDETNQPQ